MLDNCERRAAKVGIDDPAVGEVGKWSRQVVQGPEAHVSDLRWHRYWREPFGPPKAEDDMQERSEVVGRLEIDTGQLFGEKIEPSLLT